MPVLLSLLCAPIARAASARQAQVAAAVDPLPATQVAADLNPRAMKAVEAKKLPATIKINPGDLPQKSIKIENMHSPAFSTMLSPAFYAAWKTTTDSYGYLATAIPRYEQQLKIYTAKCEECKTRTYSSQDMTAAGCQPTDTVAACSLKLYRWCSAPSEPTNCLDVIMYFDQLGKYGKAAREEFIKSAVSK